MNELIFEKIYLIFPDFSKVQIRLHYLTWSHYRCFMRVSNEKAREWYINEAKRETWNVRTLDRNISSLPYEAISL